MTPTNERVESLRRLPTRKAARIAWRNIRVRLGRSILVMSGIVLAIAFLMYILLTESYTRWAMEQNSAELLSRLKPNTSEYDQSEGLNIETIWMVSVALIICFVGILNSMVMSVTERTKEIGTMKCLGALDSFIVKMYLLESFFQGLIGTIVGIGVGTALAFGEAFLRHGHLAIGMIPLNEVFLLFSFSFLAGVVLTVLGALYPAIHASRMQPVEAMRTEV